MSKPYEQEWKKDEHQAGRIHATEGITLEVRVAFWRIPGGDTEALRQAQDVEALALAAPDMARALLRMMGAGVCNNTGRTKVGCAEIQAAPCQACEARAALRKAGVL
jgi:hypothetical protein